MDTFHIVPASITNPALFHFQVAGPAKLQYSSERKQIKYKVFKTDDTVNPCIRLSQLYALKGHGFKDQNWPLQSGHIIQDLFNIAQLSPAKNPIHPG